MYLILYSLGYISSSAIFWVDHETKLILNVFTIKGGYSTSRSGGPGPAQFGQMWINNADGVQLGAIGIIVGCIPLNLEELAAC